MAVTVQVDSGRAVVALGKFRATMQQNEEMLSQIGASMLVSIRRTFRDQGVPADSWVPLSPNTIRRNPRVYGAGHKLLILSGALLNSITYRVIGAFGNVRAGAVEIGTTLKYAAVHQFGSRDRSVAIGPQSAAESKSVVDVRQHSYARLSAELGTGRLKGRVRRIQGPRNAQQVHVGAHTRHQNIPPRPFLVFRPEDPGRIRGIVQRYVRRASAEAGLGGATA